MLGETCSRRCRQSEPLGLAQQRANVDAGRMIGERHAGPANYGTCIHVLLVISVQTEITDTTGRLQVRDARAPALRAARASRSEEHTSELQSHSDLVCRL